MEQLFMLFPGRPGDCHHPVPDRTFTVSVSQGKFFNAWRERKTLMTITFDSWLLTRGVRFVCGGKTTEFDGGMLATATVLLSLRLAQRMFITVTSLVSEAPAHFFQPIALSLFYLPRTSWSVIS